MCALMLAHSINIIVQHKEIPGIVVFGAIFTILSLIGGAFVWVLFFFHINLTSKNMTTNEFCKKSWEGTTGNPFSKVTCFKNIAKIFCGRTAKSTVDPEKII
jgi:hypothetical protein